MANIAAVPCAVIPVGVRALDNAPLFWYNVFNSRKVANMKRLLAAVAGILAPTTSMTVVVK